MKSLLCVMALALAGCGADGPPIAPTQLLWTAH